MTHRRGRGPWPSRDPSRVWFTPSGPRIAFVHELRAAGHRARRVIAPAPHQRGFAVRVSIRVPGLPERTALIVFGHATSEYPRVFVDGPRDSPHRYKDDSLCIWFPDDPPLRRWRRRDGPHVLVGLVVAHLLREQHWRRTGRWPGPEAPHPPGPTVLEIAA